MNLTSSGKISASSALNSTKRSSASFDCLIVEAERRGITVAPLGARNFLSLVALSGHEARLFGTITSRTSHLAVMLADDKRATKDLLLQRMLPTPAYYSVDVEDEAVNAFRALGGWVAIKPQKGYQGRGVRVGLTTEDEVRAAYRIAAAVSRVVLVERHCPGRDYRVTIVDGKVVAVSERKPPEIIGDGIRSIAEWIAELNRDPQRGDGQEKPMVRLRVDERMVEFLHWQGRTLQSVPKQGEKVQLHAFGSLSQGSSSIDRTDEIHPELASLCEEAATLIGLDVAGVDLIAQDVALPLASSNVQIIEINCSPGLRGHLFPSEGVPRNPAVAILDYLFPESIDKRLDTFQGVSAACT